MKNMIVCIAMLITAFLGGCGQNSGAPQAVLDAALNKVKQYCVEKARGKLPSECGELTITDAKGIDLKPSHKQMGYTDVYHVMVAYAFKRIPSASWEDKTSCIVVSNKDGNLSTKLKSPYQCNQQLSS